MSHLYALLTPERVLQAVESLGLISDARILALNSYENRVYQVGIEDNAPVIVKFYRPERFSAAAILEEHAFAWQLKDEGLPVVAPLRFDDQTLHQTPAFASLAEHEVHANSEVKTGHAFYFAVFPRFGGHAPELDVIENLRVLGRALARWHNFGALARFEHRLNLDIERLGFASRAYLLDNAWIPEALIPAYDSLTADLLAVIQARWPAQMPLLRLHGDCHPGNILWREGPVFVDLDDCVNGPEVQDLWMLIAGTTDERAHHWQVLLEGYTDFRHFDLAQLQWVESLRSLRLMHYSAWLARRWDDPAFQLAFPWFQSQRYWADHILCLREQRAALDEAPPELWL